MATKTKNREIPTEKIVQGMESDHTMTEAMERKERLEGILRGYWKTEIEHFVNLSADLVKEGDNLDPYFVEQKLDLALELARAGLARYKHALRRYLGGQDEL